MVVMKSIYRLKRIWVWLVPVLAILVIYATLTLGKNTGKNKTEQKAVSLPAVKVTELPGSMMKLAFVPGGISFQPGETAKVDLWLTPKKGINLDGINLIISFNPEFLQVTQIETPKLFSSVIEDKEVGKDGKIHLIFLEEKAPGVFFQAPVKLLTLSIKGRALGEGEMSLIFEGGETVITQTKVSKKVLFDYGNLKVVVN